MEKFREKKRNWKRLCVSLGAFCALWTAAGCVSYEEVKAKADAGDCEMQYQAAMMLREGDGVKADPKLSAEYLQRSFQAGYLPAACQIVREVMRDDTRDRSKEFLAAYDLIFSKTPVTYTEIYQSIDVKMDYPKNAYRYMVYLVEHQYGESAFHFKKEAMKYFDAAERESADNRRLVRYRQALLEIKTDVEIAEEKRAAEEARRAEEQRRIAEEQRFESPEFQFPMRHLSDNRLPFSKEYLSGVSFQYLRHKKLLKHEDEIIFRCKNYFEEFDGFTYEVSSSEKLFFSCGEWPERENAGKSVLVRRDTKIDDCRITAAMAVENIKKKYPGVTVKKTVTPLGKKKERGELDDGTPVHYEQERFEDRYEIQNDKQIWILTQIRGIDHIKESKAWQKRHGISDGPFTENLFISVSDRKLVEAFVNMSKKRQQEREQQQQREREQTLDAL